MPSSTTEAKLRGGYYTPEPIANFLARWAVRPGDHVLEPSAGDGALVRAASVQLRGQGTLDSVELYAEEARKIAEVSPDATVHHGDVFAWYHPGRDETYDVVVGNPPFIRYQNFPEEHRAGGFALMHHEGLKPNRLTNAWVPFVVLATRALKPGGRLALVLPAELLQVTYAGELRAYLARRFRHLTVITFRRLVFDGIQQETVLLLGVKGSQPEPATMSFVELSEASELEQRSFDDEERVTLDLDHAREKWTQYYLSARELGLIREIEQSAALTSLGALADVDVGIVTGRNEFFVLTPSQAESLGLMESCVPLVGRSAQIPGLVLRTEEWSDLASADGKCLLLQLGKTPREQLTRDALAYVEHGEAAGFHTGYKCRIRQPTWWFVPSTAVPDGFMLRQIHDGPKIVANDAKATSTDTIHRVRVKSGTDVNWLAAASMNSITFAFSEIRGRSYGGGVLELEPNEADNLPFPRPTEGLCLEGLDQWARQRETEKVLDEVDRLILREIGFTPAELDVVRGIWRKLSGRRLGRKRRSSD